MKQLKQGQNKFKLRKKIKYLSLFQQSYYANCMQAICNILKRVKILKYGIGSRVYLSSQLQIR